MLLLEIYSTTLCPSTSAHESYSTLCEYTTPRCLSTTLLSQQTPTCTNISRAVNYGDSSLTNRAAGGAPEYPSSGTLETPVPTHSFQNLYDTCIHTRAVLRLGLTCVTSIFCICICICIWVATRPKGHASTVRGHGTTVTQDDVDRARRSLQDRKTLHMGDGEAAAR